MKILAYILLLLLATGCTTKIVPIQMARVVQIARYKQNYKFENHEQARNVLIKVVGEKNWQIIEDQYVFGDVVQDMMAGRFEIEGHIIFSLSLNPENLNEFFMDGFGKYHLHRKTTNEIILSADYEVVNDKAYSLSSVKENGYIELAVVKNYTRYFAPNERNYFHPKPLTFKLYVKELKPDVYTVDYTRMHDVYVNDELLGEIEFKPPHKHMIIDLRSLDYLKNDY